MSEIEGDEEDIRFNAHALLKDCLRRLISIQSDDNFVSLEDSDIAHDIESMSMNIEDYLLCMKVEP